MSEFSPTNLDKPKSVILMRVSSSSLAKRMFSGYRGERRRREGEEEEEGGKEEEGEEEGGKEEEGEEEGGKEFTLWYVVILLP